MASPSSRPGAVPDPVRQQLVEVRRGLLRLHKALIDSERATYERDSGPLTSGQLLRALLEEPFFEWLRPFSRLIVEIDEALASREPMSAETARGYIDQVRGLVESGRGEDDADAEGQYQQLVRRDPDVLIAHVELVSRFPPD